MKHSVNQQQFEHTTADEMNFISRLGTWSVDGHHEKHRVHLARYLRIVNARPAETWGKVDADVVKIFLEGELRLPEYTATD
jgi:hypothetical protein